MCKSHLSQYLFTHSQQKQEPYKALHIAPALNSEHDSVLVGKLQAAEGRKGTIDQLKLNTEYRGYQLYPTDKRTAKEIMQAKLRDSPVN